MLEHAHHVIDIEALRKFDEGSRLALRLIEGLADNAIDVRSEILCCLSAESGEWSFEGLVHQAKRYRMLGNMMLDHANRIVADGDAEFLVFEVMTQAAERAGQPGVLPWMGTE